MREIKFRFVFKNQEKIIKIVEFTLERLIDENLNVPTYFLELANEDWQLIA